MLEILKRIVTDFNQHTLTILIGSMLLILCVLVFYWFYNKRKFNRLTHQIPASVVKSYLDSIIQNSTSLKSSLFRGGGLDVEGVPSVLPVSDLGKGAKVEISNAATEELNQKNAEIAGLKNQLSEKEKIIGDLEKQLASAGSDTPVDTSEKDAQIAALRKEVEDLKTQLAAAPAADGGDSSEELSSITKERDELKEKLQEYEIIEDDLANLKRLQQENAQLRAALENAGQNPDDIVGGDAPAPAPAAKEAAVEETAPEPIPEAAVEETAPEPIPEAAVEETAPEPIPEAAVEETAPEPIPEAAVEEAAAKEAAPAEPAGEEVADAAQSLEGEEKSAEDLLDEFEKMLG